jgi:hypothetical protein
LPKGLHRLVVERATPNRLYCRTPDSGSAPVAPVAAG